MQGSAHLCNHSTYKLKLWMRELETKHLLNLREILQGRYLSAVSAGFSGTPVILSLDRTRDYRLPEGRVKLRSDTINNYRIHYFLGEELKHIELTPTHSNYHDIQPLGSDRWLAVSARASGYYDKNAHIYSSCGELIHSFHVRDGVETIQATETGRLWITSDCGWGTELVCLDETGQRIFKYEGESPSIHSSLHTLFCYAMNVASERDIWTYCDTAYYPGEFSLVHISNEEIRREWFPFPLQYQNAFALNKDYHALFDGDYGDYALFAGTYQNDSLFLVSLNTMGFEELIPVDESGKAIKSFRAFGRGSRLFLYTDDALSLVRLDRDNW